jgi:hypothetical protein
MIRRYFTVLLLCAERPSGAVRQGVGAARRVLDICRRAI